VADCASREHDPKVPATIHGTFANPYNEYSSNADTWYCDHCASIIEQLGFFTPDKVNRDG
jgi:hypothetical protein